VLGDLARNLGLVALAQNDMTVTAAESARGKLASQWVLMARNVEDLGALAHDARWLPIPPRSNPVVWTDDFSSLLSILRWTN
jgi:hypothetical protein